MNDRIGTQAKRYAINIAYVVLPSNVEREKYIQDCIRNNTVDCLTETGDFIKDTFVARGLMSNISFPAKVRQMGTAVILVTVPKYNQCIVIGILPKGDEIEEIKEKQFYFVSETENGIVTLSGVGSDPGMYINIESFTDSGGDLIIDISNKSNTGNLKINVKGFIEVIAENNITVSSKTQIINQVLDENGDQKRMITINPDFILLGEGTEPVLLGNTTRDLLKDIIDAIAAITTTTALGPMPILNKAQVTLLKNNIDRILSEKVKTD